MRIRFALVFGIFCASPLLAQAPAPGDQLVDRTAAVVGDTSVLLSDLQEDIQRLQASGQPIPDDPAQREALFRQVLNRRVDDLILLQAAKHAGTQIGDPEVAAAVDQQVAQFRQQFGADSAFQAALAREGYTLPDYRALLTRLTRDRFLRDRFVRDRLQAAARPTVSDAEIQQFFDAQKSSLGTRPANVSLEQAIVEPQPSDSAKQAAQAKALDVLRQLQEGGDFAVLAKRYSDDPGTKEQGGELGWFRTGQMVSRFEQVAYALRPGQTSGVVETDFGYHIIRLEKVRGAERQARHILIRPEITEADRARARARADSIAGAVRGGASLRDFARETDTSPEERTREHIPVDQLPAPYATAIGEAGTGTVVGPFEVTGGTRGESWVVARVTERQGAGEYALADVRDQVVSRVQEDKMIQELIRSLRRSTYVDVQL